MMMRLIFYLENELLKNTGMKGLHILRQGKDLNNGSIKALE